MDYCVCCGRYVPEGRMVCPICEEHKLYGSNKGELHKMRKEIVFMDEGVLAEQGTPEEIFNNPQNEHLKRFININF